MKTNGIDLTKYINLNFKAVVDGRIVSGKILPEDASHIRLDFEYTRFYIHDDNLSRLIDGESIELLSSSISDFEIIPRDPETYKDWQVGDKVCEEEHKNACYEVIFRSGELVLFKDWNNWASNPMTCSEAFTRFGMRLVLTDIEKQIIEERKKPEWKPQDGDICYVKANNEWIFIKKDSMFCSNMYVGFCIERNRLYYSDIITDNSPKELRPATNEEKKKLFDTMAKEGKRWNAEKKVVEDIPKTYEFKKGEPVLVRDGDDDKWEAWVFGRYGEKCEMFKYFMIDGPGYLQCIPLNDKTMHLLGTTEDCKEEKL